MKPNDVTITSHSSLDTARMKACRRQRDDVVKNFRHLWTDKNIGTSFNSLNIETKVSPTYTNTT
jgi:hypothetical protein